MMLARRIGRGRKLVLGQTSTLEYPELELSNNLAENSMRPVLSAAATGSILEARKLDPGLQR
jgi:hypothetical protein